jgi:hypothetical protein
MLVGCAVPPPSTVDARPHLSRRLAPYGVEPTSVASEVAMLAWQAPPGDCAHVYRITTSYEPDLKFEDDSVSYVALGPKPERDGTMPALPTGPIGTDEIVEGRLFYQGLRAERDGASRDVSFGRELYGPAAPTAACLPQTWDPMEDAFALGWPRLTGRLTAVGEHFAGLRVEAKCNRAACVDPKTGGGGPDTHDRTCVTQDWQETLLGIYEIGGEGGAERYAWMHSTWTDGQGGKGIDTERFTLVSIEHGRPVWSRTTVDHRFVQPTKEGPFAPVVRTWQLEAIDACPGSLAAAGWSRPDDVAAEATRLAEELGRTDELRRSRRRDEARRQRTQRAGADAPDEE